MINYIEGRLVEKNETMIVVDCGGLGYEINVSTNTINTLPYLNEVCKILTYMQIKEDGIALFGFANREEKEMFMKLISISGIGPKVAIGILSGLSLSDLIIAISKQDVKMLCTIKGLGKKTAERVLLELKDQVFSTNAEPTTEINQTAIDEATDALISLGVGKNEAYRLARDNAAEGLSVEEIITKALRGMGN